MDSKRNNLGDPTKYKAILTEMGTYIDVKKILKLHTNKMRMLIKAAISTPDKNGLTPEAIATKQKKTAMAT